MATLDYKNLGFKCGLEIHQQLDTPKLFCNCPSLVRDPNEPDMHFTRKLHPVIGETGEIDVAAAHEFAKGKSFLYEAAHTSSCLIEMDEEPPFQVNKEALQITLQIAKLLNMKVIDEIQVMRKIVIDGSNVTGFQRTMLVGVDGYIDTSAGQVGIPILLLEEEAAQKGETTEDHVKYKLDRLGVALVEIATDASIKDPEHAKEVAEKIGMILRSTNNVKRGIGSIRQDVNISIEKGARTEIKGFQDLKSIPKVINFEINRQIESIKKGEKIEKTVRKAEPDLTTSFLRPLPGAARLYPETDVLPVRITKDLLEEIEGVELIEDKVKDLVKRFSIQSDLAKNIVKEGKDKLLDKILTTHKNLKSAFVVDTLLSAPKQIKKQYNVDISPSEDDYKTIFDSLDKAKIAKESVLEILKENKPVKDIISQFELMSDKDLEKELKEIVALNKDLPFNALIGKAMEKLRGKAEGKKIVEILKKLTA